MRNRLIESLDEADLYLRVRADSKPAVLNHYDIEALKDIARTCDEAARTLEKAIIPPCNVGDTVYYLRYQYEGKMIPIPCTVDSIVFDGRWLKVYGIEERQNTQMWYESDFGKIVFTDKKEALKEAEEYEKKL